MAIFDPATVLFDNGGQGKLDPLVGCKTLVAFGTTTTPTNGVALIRYPSIENLSIVVMTKGAAQCGLFSLVLNHKPENAW